MRRRIAFIVFLLFSICIPVFYGNAESYIVTYDEYVNSPEFYTDNNVSFENLTVWSCNDVKRTIHIFGRDIINSEYTIYAYEKEQKKIIAAIPEKPLSDFLWYSYGDYSIGLTGKLYLGLPEELRVAMHPIEKIEKLVKGDSIIIYGAGKGMTESNDPKISVSMIWICP